jgi:hypothetical protein
MNVSMKEWGFLMMQEKKPRILPTIRRSQEQIRKDNDDFANCRVCDEPLKKTHHERTTAKMCGLCRGDATSENSKVRQITTDLQRNPPKPSEDEMWFDDDPIAVKEKDEQRYIKKAPEVSFGQSELVEIMSSSTSHHHYKRGSARNGIRYTYKKDKSK